MQWYECTENPEMLTKYYHDVPSLQEVPILKIIWEDGFARLLIHFDLPSFADLPPEAWVRQGYNTVQVHLAFLQVEMVAMEQWTMNDGFDIEMERLKDGHIAFNATAASCSLQALARSCRLLAVKAYCSVPSEY